MNFEAFSFGSIRIDGVTYEHDVIIDGGTVRKRKKKPSKQFREEFGHTPVSVAEEIPWDCKRLVIGTGGGALPVMDRAKLDRAKRVGGQLTAPLAISPQTSWSIKTVRVVNSNWPRLGPPRAATIRSPRSPASILAYGSRKSASDRSVSRAR